MVSAARKVRRPARLGFAAAYLGPAEFYNNFGRFDVRTSTCPAGWIVTATGELQNPDEVWGDRRRASSGWGAVLESDEEIMIVGPENERRCGEGHRAG